MNNKPEPPKKRAIIRSQSLSFTKPGADHALYISGIENTRVEGFHIIGEPHMRYVKRLLSRKREMNTDDYVNSGFASSAQKTNYLIDYGLINYLLDTVRYWIVRALYYREFHENLVRGGDE